MFPETVSVVKSAVMPESIVAKNEDEVALFNVVLPVAFRLVVERLVVVALVSVAFVAPRLVEVLLVAKEFVEVLLVLVRLVIVPEAAVREVMVVVAKVVIPDTTKVPVAVRLLVFMLFAERLVVDALVRVV